MKKHLENAQHESGQALVLIALAFVVMMGFAALAVDFGSVFASRRRAQSAADSAALSAAYALCSGEDLFYKAFDMITLNGYDIESVDEDGNYLVEVYNPPIEGPYVDDPDYIEVTIKVISEPIFSSFVYNGPLESTVRAVSHCTPATNGAAYNPGLGNGVSILALNPSASHAITNLGGAEIDVDGGVYVNSTANDAFYQTGSATMKMNWAKVRGGAELGGAFGTYLDGSGGYAKVIDVVKDFKTSGSGKAISGAFNIGGNVINSASVNMTGDPMNVGGNFDNSGAATVVAPSLLIGGNVINKGSGSFTSQSMTVGGNITADGGSWFRPSSGNTLNLRVGGNIDLSGSAAIGSGSNANVTVAGTVTKSGGSKINGTVSKAAVTKPTFSVDVPYMEDPLATVLYPPEPPTTSCETLNVPNWGTHNLDLVSGKYYCKFDIGGSANVTIPPGTYWVNSFSLGGAAKLKMDGVQLYITGNGTSNGFTVGGSGSISMLGTMVYIQSGSFSFSGASGTLDWTAPESGEYHGLSLFLDRENSSKASLSGSAAIGSMSGTWYAPASACSFTGNTNTTVYSQFICDTVTVTGSSKLLIKYDSNLIYQVGQTGSPSTVSLVE